MQPRQLPTILMEPQFIHEVHNVLGFQKESVNRSHGSHDAASVYFVLITHMVIIANVKGILYGN